MSDDRDKLPVVVGSNGKYVVTVGNHRIKALKELETKNINCIASYANSDLEMKKKLFMSSRGYGKSRIAQLLKQVGLSIPVNCYATNEIERYNDYTMSIIDDAMNVFINNDTHCPLIIENNLKTVMEQLTVKNSTWRRRKNRQLTLIAIALLTNRKAKIK